MALHVDHSDQYAEVFDEGHEPIRDGVHQRIRANSSIMHLNKILVANRGEIPIRVSSLTYRPIASTPVGSSADSFYSRRIFRG